MKLYHQIFKLILIITPFLTAPAYSAEKKMPEMFSYATYFYCDAVQEEAIDKLVASNYASVYDASVKSGDIKNWGWLAHHTGGKWRRILYHSGPSIDALFAAQTKMNKTFVEKFGKAPDALMKGCKSHEDYIWQYVAGSASMSKALKRGKASMSVYWECSFNGEERADDIVKNHFSKVFNKHLGEGKLTSWGWLSHVIGGKYRRLETLSAENYSDLLKAKNSILSSIYGKGDNKVAEEFTSICTSHSDYLWDVKVGS